MSDDLERRMNDVVAMVREDLGGTAMRCGDCIHWSGEQHIYGQYRRCTCPLPMWITKETLAEDECRFFMHDNDRAEDCAYFARKEKSDEC